MPSTRDQAIGSYLERPAPVRLECRVQPYAWGDAHTIASLLGRANPESEPQAELWMGAHEQLPSRVVLGDARVPLNQLIERAPAVLLGKDVAATFNARLPFLLKVLAAATPLSIQTHPTTAKARAGFAREVAAGLPLSARERSYKDDSHKPELIAALTDFYGLRGFRPLSEISALLREEPALRRFGDHFSETDASLRSLYEQWMTLPQDEVDALLDSVVARLEAYTFDKSDREFWLLRADREFSRDGHRDRGLLSVFLLNLIHLRPGDAMFLPAGVLHAYLEGAGMEIMANSNNVLRGGLTTKHVDVAELLDNVVFESATPQVLRAEARRTGEWVYRTPAREFELSRIEVAPAKRHAAPGTPEVGILFVTGAEVRVTSDAGELSLPKGAAAFLPSRVAYSLEASEPVTLFRATVPGV